MCHGSAFPLAWLKQSPRLVCRPSPQSTTRRLNYTRQTGGLRAMTSSEKGASLEERSVAGSFLFKIPNGDRTQAKVALFRRSGKVKTYRHKLAPCSGTVEKYDKNPLDAAFREIREETNLPASSLDLLCFGKPYSFVDESINREWNIYPFAFRLKDIAEGGKGEAGIALDWEHEAIEWFDPLQVNESDEFGGVPRLVDSLRRVWPEYDLGPEAGRALTEGLKRIRLDRQHGASELANVAVSTLREVTRLFLSHPVGEDWWPKVRMAAWHICQSRPSMGTAITGAIYCALDRIRLCYPNTCTIPEASRIDEALACVIADRMDSNYRIRRFFKQYISLFVLPNRGGHKKTSISVLTLSSSSTVLNCLSHLEVGLDLRILESRPLFEGVTAASKLLKSPSKSDLKVTLYSDASAALAARDIDVLILGADRISSAGDVSNANGSLPAVLSARHVSPDVKVLVVSDCEKIAGPGSVDEHESEENLPWELWRSWKGVVAGVEVIEDALARNDPRVAIKNCSFEWVPGNLIDGYITNQEIWSKEEIQKYSESVSKTSEYMFGEL
ncbi:hypothetical protein F5Y09DRAFT_312970 [Xylaria sp. FL1042]|nr:hypothetical protein F5Y09DRAFT_312970 [Xylaria sp. FL1042]